MQSCPFDSHKYVKQLLDAGVATPEAEAMAALAGEIAHLRRQVDTLTVKVESLPDKVESLDQRITKLEQCMAAVEQRLGAMELRMSALENTIHAMRSELHELTARIGHFDECGEAQNTKTEANIANAKNELIKWTVGLLLAHLTLTTAALKTFG